MKIRLYTANKKWHMSTIFHCNGYIHVVGAIEPDSLKGFESVEYMSVGVRG